MNKMVTTTCTIFININVDLDHQKEQQYITTLVHIIDRSSRTLRPGFRLLECYEEEKLLNILGIRKHSCTGFPHGPDS